MQSKGEMRGTLPTFLVLLAAVLVPFALMIRPYFLAVLMGIILAILSHPLYRWLRKRGWGPTRSGLVVTTALLTLVLIPVTLFVLAAIRQGLAAFSVLSERDLLSYRGLIDRVISWEPLSTMLGDPQDVLQKLVELAGKLLSTVSGLALGFAAQIPELILQLGLAIFASFFFLVDGPRFMAWLASKIPLSAATRRELFRRFRETAVSVIMASMAAASAQSLAMFIAYLALGVPAAFLAAGCTFIFAWIPIVGSTPVWGAGALYLFLQGSMGKAVLMIFIGLLTGVLDNIVRPLVLSESSEEMHPLVSLVSIFGGLAMFGIVGVFVGPILAVMVIAVLDAWPQVAHEHGIELGPLERNGAEGGTLDPFSTALRAAGLPDEGLTPPG